MCQQRGSGRGTWQFYKTHTMSRYFFMQSTFVLFSRRPLMNRPAVNLVPLRETQNASVLHKEMI